MQRKRYHRRSKRSKKSRRKSKGSRRKSRSSKISKHNKDNNKDPKKILSPLSESCSRRTNRSLCIKKKHCDWDKNRPYNKCFFRYSFLNKLIL